MDEAFSPVTRRAIVVALEEARIAGDPLVTTGHLVLGLLQVVKSAAGKALSSAGLTLDQARTFLAEQGGGKETQLEFSVGARKVLERSCQIALRKGSEEIRFEHLLDAVLDSNDHEVAEMFQVCGVERDDVQRWMAESLGRPWVSAELGETVPARLHRVFADGS